MEDETAGSNLEDLETSTTHSWIMPNLEASKTSTTHSWIMPDSETQETSTTHSRIVPYSVASETCSINSGKMSNSEASETSTTHSWIMLNTNKLANPIVWDEVQEKIKKTTTSEEIQNMSDFNKSDTESDGISIISENEFYQTRNEDDSSMNSSDENTVDNCRILEPLELQSESLQLQRSLETFAGKKESTNSSNLSEEDDEKDLSDENTVDNWTTLEFRSESLQLRCSLETSTGKKESTNFSTVTEKNEGKEKQSMISNISSIQPPNHDLSCLRFLDDHISEDCPHIYLSKRYVNCFVCTILLAIAVSTCLSSNFEEKTVEHNDQNIRYDQFMNLLIHKYCEDIFESTDDTDDNLMEECLENIMKKFEKGGKIKQTKKGYSTEKIFELDFVLDSNNNHNDDLTISGEWYMNLVRARNDIRKKDGKARWWFDRVNFRRNKRNKREFEI